MNLQIYLAMRNTLTRAASSALAFLLCMPAQGATYSGCVSVDMDTIIRTSKLVKQAQGRLVREFAKREADLGGLQRHTLEIEFAANTAKEKGNKGEEEGRLEELRQAKANWEKQKAGYDADLGRRKAEVLDGLVHQASVAYQAVGTKRGYAKLYQEGGDEPIFKPLQGAEGYQCNGKSDVTQEVVVEMDKDVLIP